MPRRLITGPVFITGCHMDMHTFDCMCVCVCVCVRWIITWTILVIKQRWEQLPCLQGNVTQGGARFAYIHEKPCELLLRNYHTLFAVVCGHVYMQIYALSFGSFVTNRPNKCQIFGGTCLVICQCSFGQVLVLARLAHYTLVHFTDSAYTHNPE